MSTMTLEPCPFCGKSGPFDHWPCRWLDATGANIVRCPYCSGAAPLATWNRRAQPAQAVDVDYAPGEIDRTAPERIWLQIDTSANNEDRGEPWPGADGVTWQDESIGGLEIQYVRADLVARALSGEKAGPAGDEADAQWTANVEIPTVARLYYTGIGSRRYKRASVQSGAGEPLCFVSTARELLRRQRAALLPASPAPDKEG